MQGVDNNIDYSKTSLDHPLIALRACLNPDLNSPFKQRPLNCTDVYLFCCGTQYCLNCKMKKALAEIYEPQEAIQLISACLVLS